MTASAVHHTAVTEGAWDGPAAVAAMPNSASVLRYCHAWRDAGAVDQKSDYKFPHHKTDGGPAFLAGVRNGLSRLSQASIPDSDRAGVERHLQAHLDDASSSSNEADVTATLRREAAEQRGTQTRAPADRPSQRRSAERAGSLAVASGRLVRCEIRGLEDPTAPLVFDGMASVYEPPDHGAAGHVCRGYEMWDMFGPYTEYTHLGSGAESLANPQLDVPLVLGHQSMRRLARTGNATSPLMLSEVNAGDRPGLHVLAPSLQRDNPHVAEVTPLLHSGLLDEMSFRFMITSGRWNDEWDEYHIHAYDINRGDVSIVGYGANPHTAGSGLRSQDRRGASAAFLIARDLLDEEERLAERYSHLHR